MSEWSDMARRMNADVLRVWKDSVVVRPPGRPPLKIEAHFDEAYETIDLQSEIPVSTVRPAVLLILADLPIPPKQGWGVDIGEGRTAKKYEVAEIQLDGDGMATLILKLK